MYPFSHYNPINTEKSQRYFLIPLSKNTKLNKKDTTLAENQKTMNQKDFLDNKEHKFESKGCLNNFDTKSKNDQKGVSLTQKFEPKGFL